VEFTQDRMITRIMTLFGILALLLATLGLYGVTAIGRNFRVQPT
jgi:hypothetical protein